MLREPGLKPLLLPARSPNLNAYAERFVFATKSECLDRIVPLGERHLRRPIVEYLAHYHGERNHQRVGNVLHRGSPEPANENGRVQRRERLRGLLNSYHRTAAQSGLDQILGQDAITFCVPTSSAIRRTQLPVTDGHRYAGGPERGSCRHTWLTFLQIPR
jgi:hypothetical protein